MVYAVLLTLGIPWYWNEGDARLWHGIPLWAWTSLGASLLTSIFTSWLILTRWPDEAHSPQPPLDQA